MVASGRPGTAYGLLWRLERGPQPVRGQERGLVEQGGQDPVQLVRGDDGQQQAAVGVGAADSPVQHLMAVLVPSWAGFTVAAPFTTRSLMPSFGNAVSGHPRVVGFVVAEQRSRLDIAGRGRVRP